MKITKLTAQIKNPDRINVFGDGKYVFSLDIAQITELNVRVGRELDPGDVKFLLKESEFGKYYLKALVYASYRPRSEKEVHDYLRRQTKSRVTLKDGVKKEYQGMSLSLIGRILKKLTEQKYIDDKKFTYYWIENRNLRKGISIKKLRQELMQKGVASSVIDEALSNSSRNDKTELRKIILKKKHRYAEEDKFKKYLLSKGYNYYDIQEALSEESSGD